MPSSSAEVQVSSVGLGVEELRCVYKLVDLQNKNDLI